MANFSLAATRLNATVSVSTRIAQMDYTAAPRNASGGVGNGTMANFSLTAEKIQAGVATSVRSEPLDLEFLAADWSVSDSKVNVKGGGGEAQALPSSGQILPIFIR